MNQFLLPEDVTSVIRSFCMINDGDDATQALILSIGAELLDVSQDTMLDMVKGERFCGLLRSSTQN